MKAKELPQMTEPDKAFAFEVHNEYKKLPLSDLCSFVNEIRETVNDNLAGLKDGFDFEKEFRKLTSPDTIIEQITVHTNKGLVRIEASNYLFSKFLNPIESAKRAFNKSEINWKSHLRRWAIQLPFDKTVIFIHEMPLGKFQKEVAVGMFIVHFKLYRGKPLLTKQQYEDRLERGSLSYKHYLSEIVKARLKKYLKDFQL